MDISELKFLLTLLGYPDYRAPLSKIRPTENPTVRNRAFRQLCDRGHINCLEEIVRFKIAPPGKALLKIEAAQLPISDVELAVLEACAQDTVTPAQALKRMAATQRQEILQALAERGLIQTETAVKEVWLTSQGQTFLQHEYKPQGNGTISLSQLSHYLAFLRQAHAAEQHPDGTSLPPHLRWRSSAKPSDDQLLQTICSLDHELGTDNYLPLFYLRQAMQPPLSRDELDQALYRLQRQDRIELSSLQEAIAYTQEQINAGIAQDIGGPLFFLTVVAE
ncbi:MAG: hypothetical protein VKK04_19000 [Synechococcales bacterium]|nr:hypothetical protein [Synechococcales bacterium]